MSEVLSERKTLTLRARARFFDITFEVYAFRELAHDEVHHIVAAYLMGNRGGVAKGATYKIVSDVGIDD